MLLLPLLRRFLSSSCAHSISQRINGAQTSPDTVSQFRDHTTYPLQRPMGIVDFPFRFNRFLENRTAKVMSLNSLPLVPPELPDFDLCSGEYGVGIRAADCLVAARYLVESDTNVPFNTEAGRQRLVLSLPLQRSYG